MLDIQSSKKIPINSVIITDRTRKEFGDINSLADSIALIGLLAYSEVSRNIVLYSSWKCGQFDHIVCASV